MKVKAIRHWFVFALLAYLVGCSSIGLQKPETFNEQLAFQYGNLTAIYSAVATSVQVGSLKPDDAEKVIESADAARTSLDAARIAYNAGDITTAEGRLQAAIVLLTALQTQLHSQVQK
jgi:hypothetical protein